MPLTAEQLTLIDNWSTSKIEADRYKQLESSLRDQVVLTIFSSTKEEGSESIEIVNGWLLKATKKLDYKLSNDQEQITALVALLDKDVATKLIKWKPDLSIGTYKNLDKETQILLNGCLTIKPAKPSLELIPPKEGK